MTNAPDSLRRPITREYTIVDVFSEVPLEGNPLAVFTDGGDLPAELMQRAARELNLSETVFVGAGAAVRIFTPQTELEFAGHPVLGTAIVLAENGRQSSIELHTPAGPIPVRIRQDGDRTPFAELEHPLPRKEQFGQVAQVLNALGDPTPKLPLQAYRNGALHVIVVLEDPEQVADLQPDLTALKALGSIAVSCAAPTGPHSVKTRMFAPGLGVPEDPATGSAAGPLILHLASHQLLAFGEDIEIRQGEEIERPSVIRARVEELGPVTVGGHAAIVARGSFRLA